MAVPKYTPDQIEFMRALWDKGDPCSTISAIFNARYGDSITNRAVIGVAHRQGFDRRGSSGSWLEEGARKRVATMKASGTPFGRTPNKPVLVAPVPSAEPIASGPINDWGPSGTCQWMAGSVRDLEWQFCAAPGYPFCSFHAQKCYNKPLPAKP